MRPTVQTARAGVIGAQELEGEDRKKRIEKDSTEPVVPNNNNNRSFMEPSHGASNEGRSDRCTGT